MYNAYQYNKTALGNASVVSLIGGTAQIFSGPGTIHAIVVGTTSSTAFVAFDMVDPGSAAPLTSGTVAILKSSIAENTYLLDAVIAQGLYVRFGTGGTYTVLWTKN